MMRTLVILLVLGCSFTSIAQQNEDYLSWSAQQATATGRKWRVAGRAGWGSLRNPLRSDVYYYDVRATLMTPEAIRACARVEQLRRRLSDAETRELVSEAEKTDGLVAMIEINPREGSGVIPTDWRAILRPKGAKENSPEEIVGTNTPSLRHVKAFAGVNPRDYNYDLFWMVFPLKNPQGKPVWENPPNEIEIVIVIGDRQGRMSWHVNDSLHQRLID